MPIYEYRCRSCGAHLEVMRKVSDPPLRKCRSCGGRLDKMVSRTSFQLKGQGWFAHGYTSGPSPSDSRSDTEKPDKPAPSGTEGAKGSASADRASARGKAAKS
jgi:putative FmdB family regulatory protein